MGMLDEGEIFKSHQEGVLGFQNKFRPPARFIASTYSSVQWSLES
jgi:hypothetical protein